MSRPFQNLQFKREINGTELKEHQIHVFLDRDLYLEGEKHNSRDIFILHNRGWSNAGLAKRFVICIPCIEMIIARVEKGYTDDTVILERSSDSDSDSE